MDDVFRLYNGPLTVEGTSGVIAERWTAVQSWGGTASASQVPALVDAMYGTGIGPQELWSALQSKDETLVPEIGSPTTRLLNAAALDYLFTHNGSTDVAAALAVLTSSFGDRKPSDIVVDVGKRAAAELNYVSDLRRTRSDLREAAMKIAADAPAATKQIAELGKDLTAEKAVAALNEILKSTAKSLDKLASETRTAILAAERRVSQADEECDVLWFVFGGESKTASKAFSELSVSEAAFYAAAELAELSTRPIHSQSFRALLERLGSPNTTVTVKSAVEGIPPEWIVDNVPREPSHRMLPLHRLLDRYREFGAPGAAWARGSQDLVGFSPSLKVTGFELALQFYRERLLQKALK